MSGASFVKRLHEIVGSINSDTIEDDLFWMPDDPDMSLHWKIDPVTGEYTELIDGHVEAFPSISTTLPQHPPGLKYGLEHENVENVDEVICDTQGSELGDGAVGPMDGLDTNDDPSEIDSLVQGIDKIKVVYYAESLARNSSSTKGANRQEHWARNVNPNVLPDDYEQIVPNPPSFVHPFELDPFQKQAVYHIEKGESVFVAAHTSAGKTAVAEYALGLCQKHLTRAVYTSPIKALSNQKFRDFRETFGEDQVGLLTGDVQINPDAASCLIMTTEILRSMLYRDSEMIREVEWVIFDEVHYVNDAERGVVWEEVIIMLPPHVRLVLLSATTPNTFEFADWVGRTRSEIVYVIATLYRPVPLEHYIYLHKELFKIVDGGRNWSEANYKATVSKHQSMKSKQQFVGGSVLVELVYFLKKRSLLPCVVFSFSRRKCEEYVDCLSGVDLNESSSDHFQVHHFFSIAISKLSMADRDLPQLHRMEEMLKRGLAVHHSGLLPIMKETVEILFSRGLVKVLFATETFAMGVNMPARTVVFSGLKKHDGTSFRPLLPGEYTQMAGRAGRRGKDKAGTVIILAGTESGELASALTLQRMLLDQPKKLASQFRVTFGMILGLLRFEALQVEEMLKRSFSENATQKQRPGQQEQIALIEKTIAECPPVVCGKCNDTQLAELLEVSVRVRRAGASLFKKLLCEYYSRSGARYFEPGRVVVVAGKNGGRPVLILKPMSGAISVLTVPFDASSVPFPATTIDYPDNYTSLKVINVSPEDIVFVTTEKLSAVPSAPSERQLIDIKQRFAEWLSARTSFHELAIPEFKVLDLDEARIQREMGMRHLFSIDCPRFTKHYEEYYNRATLVSRLAEIQFASSDHSLALLPEYHARVSILKGLGYVDEVSGSVLLKGRVACEIRTVENSLLLLVVEVLFSGYFMKLQPAELAALLSALYFQERVDADDEQLFHGLPDSLVDACYHMEDSVEELTKVQRSLGLQVNIEDAPLRFGLVPVVYYWSLGEPFSKIALITDVLEGTIVRCVVRLEEGLRELCHAAKIMGDLELASRFEGASVRIKRDICFASSLYL